MKKIGSKIPLPAGDDSAIRGGNEFGRHGGKQR